ncbi:MAG TPA: NADH-quinone oxidoreductase subunit J [Armatimonadota bacterium]|jgi:NADH-quinone oxidoreductase subunit J
MTSAFYVSGVVAVLATIGVVTGRNAVHALLYLIASLFALALVFFTLGAPFAAALEVIIYAGAIVVLFVFVVMMLNLGPKSVAQEREWLRPGVWIGPAVLAITLMVELGFILSHGRRPGPTIRVVGPTEVGVALYGPYMLGVEMASMLLLAGLLGAYHLGRRHRSGTDAVDGEETRRGEARLLETTAGGQKGEDR